MIARTFAGLGLCFFLPAAAGAGDVLLGQLVINYQDTVWRAEELLEGQVVHFTCQAGDCLGFDDLQPDLYAFARPVSPKGWRTCDATRRAVLTRDSEYGPFTYARRDYAGIEFNITGLVSGCRLRTPTLFQACGEHEGIIYWLTTAFSSCSPEPDLPIARFDEILQGMTLLPLEAE